ncbi:hypothetical protein pb186bvf_003820 [Paramecium bursaria]
MQYLQQLDQCGSDFKLRPLDQNDQYKSIIGGLGSFIIYSSCLSYFIFGMYQWYDNQILPTVVNIQQYEPIVQTTINDNLISLKFKEQFNSTLNSPFSYYENILTILLFTNRDGKFSVQTAFSNDTTAINLSNIYLSSNQVNKSQSYYSISICKCIASYVGSCANQSVVDDFFKQRQASLDIKIYLKQYNYREKKYEIVEEQFGYPITKFNTFYTQIKLSMTKSSVQDNFLFGGSEDSTYISKYELISQTPDISYMINSFNQTVYQSFLITVNNLVQDQQVLYPSLGDVLASIGSIIDVLLLLKFIFIFINEKVCFELVLQRVISFYYPEFATQILINRGFGGFIQSVYYNGIQLDTELFKQQYAELRSTAINKLTFTNTLYEISRIQFLLGLLIKKDQFLSCHNMGIKFKLKAAQEEEMESGVDLSIDPDQFGILNLLENSHQISQMTRVFQLQS